MNTEKPVVQIENSSVFATLGGHKALQGNVVDHPHIDKGVFVRTSKILKEDGDTVETMNTIYKIIS